MDAVGRLRGHVLLGHSPRDPFSGEEVRQRDATDFSDVFGGPPRRYSLCETRSSLGDSGDDSEPGERLERQDSIESNQRWPSSAEKPVFGVLDSPARRRNLGDDFFNDIFRGNESPCSTPRRLDRDRFASTPTSSFLSPSRPLPPATDIFGGDSSAPNLSYSSRLGRSSDYSPLSSPTPRAARKNEESAANASSHPSINSPSRSIPRAPPSHRTAESAAVDGKEPPTKEEDKSPKDNSASDNPHFSMYKWASKGVTLVMPPISKERSKGRSRLGGVYAQVSQEPNLPPDKENLPQRIPTFQNPGETEDKTLNPVPAENNKIPSPNKAAEVLRDITDLSDDADFFAEARKPGVKNLRILIDEDFDREEKEDASKLARERENAAAELKRAARGIENPPKLKQETISKAEDRPTSKGVNVGEDRIKHQPSSARVAPASDNSDVQRVDGFFFSESTIKDLDEPFCEIDVTDFEDVEDCVFENLSQDSIEVRETHEHEEEIQKSDAKIREWSRGREGNIRSLLSTLQCVLWPGSGWKPVRLADIIEAPSVRRAYQRALLYLHPDKLQQKGADVHHKYIAQKVFSILQEAWDHFNSLGAI